MTKPKAPTPERILVCVHCDQKLWTVRILAWQGDKPWSTEWIPWVKTLAPRPPVTWDCPLCGKDFAPKDKLGRPNFKMIDSITGERSRVV